MHHEKTFNRSCGAWVVLVQSMGFVFNCLYWLVFACITFIRYLATGTTFDTLLLNVVLHANIHY